MTLLTARSGTWRVKRHGSSADEVQPGQPESAPADRSSRATGTWPTEVLEHVVHADDDKQAARELKATALGQVACMAEA